MTIVGGKKKYEQGITMKLIYLILRKSCMMRSHFYFIDKVKKQPRDSLSLANGSTPVPLYERLIIDHKVNHTSYKKVKSFNLDEYIGLPRTHEQSYYTFMNNNLFKHIDIN